MRTGQLRAQAPRGGTPTRPLGAAAPRRPGRLRGRGLGTKPPVRSRFGPASDPGCAQPPVRSPGTGTPHSVPCHSLTGKPALSAISPHGLEPRPGPAAPRRPNPSPAVPYGPRRRPCRPPSAESGGQSPQPAAPHQEPETPPVSQRLAAPRPHRPPAHPSRGALGNVVPAPPRGRRGKGRWTTSPRMLSARRHRLRRRSRGGESRCRSNVTRWLKKPEAGVREAGS